MEKAGLSNKRLLGEILIEMGVIDQEQLNTALNKQDQTNPIRDIGAILRDLDYVSESQLAKALEIQRDEALALMPHIILKPPSQDLDPQLTTKKYVEIPKFKSPTITVGVESVYGLYNARGGLLDGVGLFRQDGETDEALAERASQSVKKLLLAALEENKEYRKQFEELDSILPNIDAGKILEDFMTNRDD